MLTFPEILLVDFKGNLVSPDNSDDASMGISYIRSDFYQSVVQKYISTLKSVRSSLREDQWGLSLTILDAISTLEGVLEGDSGGEESLIEDV